MIKPKHKNTVHRLSQRYLSPNMCIIVKTAFLDSNYTYLTIIIQ